MLPITKPLPSSTRSILAGTKAYEHFHVESAAVLAILPNQFKAVVSCMQALPPAIVLGFNAKGELVGHCYLGDSAMTLPDTPAAPVVPPAPKVVLPELPIIGKVDGTEYEIK